MAHLEQHALNAGRCAEMKSVLSIPQAGEVCMCIYVVISINRVFPI